MRLAGQTKKLQLKVKYVKFVIKEKIHSYTEEWKDDKKQLQTSLTIQLEYIFQKILTKTAIKDTGNGLGNKTK